MDQILSFIVEHWALSASLGVIIILLLLNEWRYKTFGVSKVEVQELVEMLSHSGAAVIDCRSRDSFEQGHILGAMSIPQEEIDKRITSLNKYKSKPIILVCTAGLDSPKAIKVLSANGFTQLYYLSGGMDMWLSQSMPVVKK